MHIAATKLLIAASTTGTSTTGTTRSSSSVFILFLLLAGGAMWLLVVRPNRRKQKLARSMQSDLAVGDEILTAGGVYGKVTRVDDDDVGVEIAPGVEVRLARRAIAAQLSEPAPEDDDADGADAESDEENPG